MSSSSSKYFTFLSIGSPYYLSSNVKVASFPLSLILFCWQKLSFSTSPHQYQKLSRLCKTRQAPCHNILVISSVANDVLTSHVLLILHPRPTPTHHNFMSPLFPVIIITSNLVNIDPMSLKILLWFWQFVLNSSMLRFQCSTPPTPQSPHGLALVSLLSLLVTVAPVSTYRKIYYWLDSTEKQSRIIFIIVAGLVFWNIWSWNLKAFGAQDHPQGSLEWKAGVDLEKFQSCLPQPRSILCSLLKLVFVNAVEFDFWLCVAYEMCNPAFICTKSLRWSTATQANWVSLRILSRILQFTHGCSLLLCGEMEMHSVALQIQIQTDANVQI